MRTAALILLTVLTLALLWAQEGVAGGIAAAPVVNADAPPAAASNHFPNPTLVDQDGRAVRLHDDLVKGRVVLINFFFTHCEAYCALETARLKRVYQLLGDRVGRDIFFYSVSIDPKRDTPEVLRTYRDRFGIGSGWTFLTGDDATITALRDHLGLLGNGLERTPQDHSLDMLVGNEATSQWHRRSNMDDPLVLAKLLGETLSEWRTPVGTSTDFADAPVRIDGMAPGQMLFKTRCADCHTHDGGPGTSLGPDLRGVTERRDAAWLKAWILAPNKVLAAQDPVALMLLARYQGLVMPNLGQCAGDADDLLTYLRGVGSDKGAGGKSPKDKRANDNAP